MESWQGWPVERLVFLFLGVAYLVVWAQLSLYHWKGGFHSKFMWGPVIFTPLAALAALLFGAIGGQTLGSVFVIIFVIAVVEGLIGTMLHAMGVSRRVGGFTMANILAGPPFLLPFTYTALALFGLLVYYWPLLTGVAR